jgi:hypothetical protein
MADDLCLLLEQGPRDGRADDSAQLGLTLQNVLERNHGQL